MKILAILCLFICTFIVSSCDKPEPTPSFIKINSIELTDTATGKVLDTLLSKVPDVWVSVDGLLLGVFELPAEIPVLNTGKSEFQVQGGIKVNGITATRDFYRFFDTYDTTLTITSDKEYTLTPSISYTTRSNLQLSETFEDPSLTLDSAQGSIATIKRTDDPDKIFPDEGSWSGQILFNKSESVAEIVSIDDYSIPGGANPAFLEMNYRNTKPFYVGIIKNTPSQITQKTIILLTVQNEWNKIYINLTEETFEQFPGTTYKIFFGAVQGSSDTEETEILLDNIKLISR